MKRSPAKPNNGRPIERAFLSVFQSVKKKLKFESAPPDDLKDHMFDALVQASTAKCVEFNAVTNRTGQQVRPSFVLLSSLRGICEDLIYLNYMSKLNGSDAKQLIKLLLRQNVAKGPSGSTRLALTRSSS